MGSAQRQRLPAPAPHCGHDWPCQALAWGVGVVLRGSGQAKAGVGKQHGGCLGFMGQQCGLLPLVPCPCHWEGVFFKVWFLWENQLVCPKAQYQDQGSPRAFWRVWAAWGLVGVCLAPPSWCPPEPSTHLEAPPGLSCPPRVQPGLAGAVSVCCFWVPGPLAWGPHGWT